MHATTIHVSLLLLGIILLYFFNVFFSVFFNADTLYAHASNNLTSSPHDPEQASSPESHTPPFAKASSNPSTGIQRTLDLGLQFGWVVKRPLPLDRYVPLVVQMDLQAARTYPSNIRFLFGLGGGHWKSFTHILTNGSDSIDTSNHVFFTYFHIGSGIQIRSITVDIKMAGTTQLSRVKQVLTSNSQNWEFTHLYPRWYLSFLLDIAYQLPFKVFKKQRFNLTPRFQWAFHVFPEFSMVLELGVVLQYLRKDKKDNKAVHKTVDKKEG